ncbi:caspase, EACC1-associated type [Amycolatopsis speibonae]|uniref:AAA domain-containing protein n=1 Tax=Amycolatopsis speibonae TaxID=1450224 RepID=A0ABV7NX31_9PSEU
MTRGRKRALLVGIGTYQSGDFSVLPFATTDTAALRRVLADPEIGQFDEVQVVDDPNAAQMRERIGLFLEDLAEEDLGLLYVSGHGYRHVQATSEFFFVASDTNLPTIERTGVSATFVNEQLEESLAGRKVAIFDCCFSGGFSLGFRTTAKKSATHRAGPPQPRGVYVMSSSGMTEASWADPRVTSEPKLSLFTAELVEALRTGKGDTGGDGIISADELFHYVNDRVRQIPIGHPQQDYQVPVSSSDKVNSRIDLARSTAGSPLRPVIPPSQPEMPPSRREPSGGTSRDSWGSLLAYYRDCLELGTEPTPLLGINEVHDSYVCVSGEERLLSHDLDTSGSIPLDADAADFIERSEDENTQLWYGYPAVVLLKDRSGNSYRTPRFAPLFIRRVEIVPDEAGDRLKPYGEVVPHPQLVRELLPSAQAETLLSTYRSSWQAGMHSQMVAEIRHFLREDFGLDAVQELRPGALAPTIDARTPNSGARNTAVLFLVTPGNNANAQLLKDLEHIAGPNGRADDTALSALAGANRPADTREWQPVAPLALNDAQRAVLESAMSRPLTVATGPPGTGKSQLVANVVATAVSNGQSVLITSTNNRAVDEVWERCERLVPGALVRTGSKGDPKKGRKNYREQEQRSIRSLMAAPPSTLNEQTSRAVLWQATKALDQVFKAVNEKAEQERDLLRIAGDRQASASALGHEANQLRNLFAGANLLELAARADRISRAKLFGSLRRKRFCRAISWQGDRSATTCASLGALAQQEVAWDNARTAIANIHDDHTLEVSLGACADDVRALSKQLLETTVRTAVHSGRNNVEALVRATSGSGTDWSEIRRSLPYLRAWAVTNHSIRRFPTTPGLFDLVIVDEASQCSIPQVIPALYRAKRALIIGDAMQLSPVITVTPARESSIRRAHGLDAAWLEARRMNYRRHSAFNALSAAASGELLLDEHYRCHPDIAAVVNERYYFGQLTILTDTRQLRRRQGNAITWSHVKGSAVRDAHGSWRNPTEAEQVTREVSALLQQLPPDSDIGVVTPFAAQAALLSKRWGHESRVRVGTVHTFQGGERDAIVLSLVADANMPARTRTWLGRQRNLWNVAITRARSTLVLVGDRDVWQGIGEIDDVLDAADAKAPRRSAPVLDELPLRLYGWLSRDPANQVELSVSRDGYHADAVVRAGADEAAILLDRGAAADASPGRHLRLEFARTRLLGPKARRVPAWQLLDDVDTY